MTQEALKLALEALYPIAHNTTDDPRGQAYKAITAIKEALAQEQEAVGYWKEQAQGLQRDYDLLLADYEKLAKPEQEPVAMLERDPSIGRLRVTFEDAVTELDEGVYPLYTKPQGWSDNVAQAFKVKERLIRIMGTFDLATGHADTFDDLLDSLESELRDVLGHYREALAQTQEPVAWEQLHEHMAGPFYQKPPQRTFVGLTEEEIKPCWHEACQTDLELTSQLVVYFARAIEAKLKERNT